MPPDCESKNLKFQHIFLNRDISHKNILEYLKSGRHIDEIHMVSKFFNLGLSFYLMESRKIS